MSIESIAIDHIFDKLNSSRNNSSSYVNGSLFHECMSDYSSQDGVTSSAHTKIFKWLRENT